jgi:hypothetical protein
MCRAVINQRVGQIISRRQHRPPCSRARRRKSTRSTSTPLKARLPNRTTLRSPRMGRNTSRSTPRSPHLLSRSRTSRRSHSLRQRITNRIPSAPRLLRPKTLHRSPLRHPTAKARVRAAGKRRPTRRKTKATTEPFSFPLAYSQQTLLPVLKKPRSQSKLRCRTSFKL